MDPRCSPGFDPCWLLNIYDFRGRFNLGCSGFDLVGSRALSKVTTLLLGRILDAVARIENIVISAVVFSEVSSRSGARKSWIAGEERQVRKF